MIEFDKLTPDEITEIREMQKEDVDRFMKNPYWKKYYETAPTDDCKKYIRFQFINSGGVITDKDSDRWNRISKDLTKEAWEHLLKYAGNNPFKPYCKKKIAELD